MTTVLQTNSSHTPNFVRSFCTQKFMASTLLLDQVIMGGVPLDPEALKEMQERGQPVSGDRLIATIEQRLKAIDMYGKYGPGVRTDHRLADGKPKASVVAMPPWDDEDPPEFVEYEDVTETKELPSGNGEEPGGE